MADEDSAGPDQLGDVTPAISAATTLPAIAPTRPGRPPSFWLALAGVGALLIIAIVLPLTLTGGQHNKSVPTAARAAGLVPKAAVFADSGRAVTDATGVMGDARALVSGRLPPARLTGTVAAALAHPPATASSPMLATPLSLSDPQLPACVASVTDGDALFGIDRISYQGQPSLLIVTADETSSTEAFGYVIGPGCALPGSGIRTVVTVPLAADS